MRRFRWWLVDRLEWLAYWVAPQISGERLDLSDIVKHIEPTDTPFMRSLKK